MGEVKLSKSGWDILYYSERVGHAAWSNQPAYGEVDALRFFFLAVQPDIVVELGTRYAGTTLAIHDIVPEARIYSVDVKNSPEDEDVICSTLVAEDGTEYGEYIPLRSWFPPHVRFLRLDFLAEQDILKGMIEREDDDRLVLFVDGYNKLKETEAYANWLRVGDILAVNNWLDNCGGAKAIEAILPPTYERYAWAWSEENLVYTRIWRRVA